MTIGDRIKLKRTEAHLTQEDIATALGVTKQTIYKYENGIVTNIPTDKIQELSIVLNTNPSYLTGWNQEKPTAKIDDELMEMLKKDETKLLLARWIAHMTDRELEIATKLLDAALRSPM